MNDIYAFDSGFNKKQELGNKGANQDIEATAKL